MKKFDPSKFFLIEDNTIITHEEIKKIISNNLSVPFIWSRGSTTDKFPYYSHTFIHRPYSDQNYTSESNYEIVSEYFNFYHNLVNRFCAKYGLQYTNIVRANINSTYFFPDYKYLDPHVDFSKDHAVILMYLNDVDTDNEEYNSTIIFDRKLDFNKKINFHEGDPYCFDLSTYKEEIPIKCEIKPKLGKIVCFNGRYYHANRFPKPGETRLVCVFNLLI